MMELIDLAPSLWWLHPCHPDCVGILFRPNSRSPGTRYHWYCSWIIARYSKCQPKWAVSFACQSPFLNSQEMQSLLKRHPNKDSMKKLACKNLDTAKCILQLKVETRVASLQLLSCLAPGHQCCERCEYCGWRVLDSHLHYSCVAFCSRISREATEMWEVEYPLWMHSPCFTILVWSIWNDRQHSAELQLLVRGSPKWSI